MPDADRPWCIGVIPRAVAKSKVTCTASPWQAQGRLWDGPLFYLRLRSGVASLGFGATHDEAVADATWGKRKWQDFDNVELWHPTDDQAWAWFDRLLAMKANPSRFRSSPVT